MSVKWKYVLSIIFIAIFVVTIVMFFIENLGWTHGANADLKVFRPYVPNTEIDFTKSGNSAKYINVKDGWGGQEPKWRCMVGDNATVKLYVKDGQNTQLMLRIVGFGVYDKENANSQKITVFANDTEIGQWNVAGNDTYSAKIPATVMTDNTLTIRFNVDSPYVSNIDVRPLGMAVREIVVGKNFAGKTKIKIGKWLKNKLKDIEVPDYKDSTEEKNSK